MFYFGFTVFTNARGFDVGVSTNKKKQKTVFMPEKRLDDEKVVLLGDLFYYSS